MDDGDRFRWLLDAITRDWCVYRDAPGGGVYQYDERSLRGAIDKAAAAKVTPDTIGLSGGDA